MLELERPPEPRAARRRERRRAQTHRRAMVLATLALILATAVGVALLWPTGFELSAAPGSPTGDPLRGEVTAVRSVPCQVPEQKGCRLATAQLSAGRRAEFQADASGSNELVEVGDQVLLYKNEVPPGADPAGMPAYAFAGFERKAPIMWLALLFAAIVLLLGRWRGVRSLAGLAISLVLVAKFIVPAILSGRDAVAVAIVGALAIMLVTILLTHGIGAKSLAAVLGTMLTLGLTIALAEIFTGLCNLSGFASDQATLLTVGQEQLSFRGLIIAGMVIGALGVLDDVTVSQASTVMALRAANPSQRFRALYTRALSVGRDHVAATVNTLVLAYVGAALPTVLLFSVAGMSFGDALNTESIAQDVVATLVGSIGLIAAVPITTAFAAAFAIRLSSDDVQSAGEAHHAH